MLIISNRARAGQLRTRIRILAPISDKSGTGKNANYRNPKYYNIYPDDRFIRCKWVSAFGTEAVTAQSLGIKELATLTMRYDPRIRADCIIQRVDTEKFYEIISQPNDVGDAHRWTELKVKGRVKAL